MARNARSQGISNSEPAISLIWNWPLSSGFHSTRMHLAAFTLPLASPTNALVTTFQSRVQPSSWLLEVRNFCGQLGHVASLFSLAGGLGRISICVIEVAPWRTEVPTQSEPASPP